MNPFEALIQIFSMAPDLIRRYPTVAVILGIGAGALFMAVAVANKRSQK